jgi:hypothetical protein
MVTHHGGVEYAQEQQLHLLMTDLSAVDTDCVHSAAEKYESPTHHVKHTAPVGGT